MTQSDIETAERLGRRRTQMLPAMAAIFAAQQAVFFIPADNASRLVDKVAVGGWILLSAVLVLLLWNGGAWLHSKSVRALLNDDVTRAHRGEALSLGFVLSMGVALAIYATAGIEPMQVREAIHIVVSIGVVVAAVRFTMLERRAYADA